MCVLAVMLTCYRAADWSGTWRSFDTLWRVSWSPVKVASSPKVAQKFSRWRHALICILLMSSHYFTVVMSEIIRRTTRTTNVFVHRLTGAPGPDDVTEPQGSRKKLNSQGEKKSCLSFLNSASVIGTKRLLISWMSCCSSAVPRVSCGLNDHLFKN